MNSIDIGYRRIVTVTAPVVVTQLTHTAMGVIDTMMVGQLGIVALAGVGLGSLISWWVLSFFVGLLQGVNTFVAQSFGAGRPKRVGQSFWHGLYLGAVAAAIVFLLSPASSLLFRWTAASVEVQAIASEYMTVRLMGAVGLLIFLVSENFYRGLGRTDIPMWGGLAELVLNCGLNYLLIFGKAGFPALGAAGAAIGTVFAQSTVGLVLLSGILFSRLGVRFHARVPQALQPRLIYSMLKVSMPIGIQVFMEMGGISVFSAVVARLGDVEMAVTNAVIQAWSAGFMMAVALGVGATTLVGQCLGAGQISDARIVLHRVLRLGYGCMAFVGAVYLLFPDRLISAFLRDADQAAALPYARPLLLIAAISLVFELRFNVLSGALRGAGDTTYSMLVNIGVTWLVFVPLVLLATSQFGLVGAWSCFIIHVGLMSVLLALRTRGQRWLELGAELVRRSEREDETVAPSVVDIQPEGASQ